MLRVRRFVRLVALLAVPTFASGLGSGGASAAPPDTSCHLQSAKGDIKHVIAVTFDNTHFTRDNPNVPSDLEQMPHLLNFIQNNGTLLSNHHTPLISHTATDILTNLTGVYGDRMGVPVSNSFRYFNPDGTSNLGVSFAYWTDPLFDPTTSAPTDTRFNMLTADGKNAPAPWVPYTRAGCNWGGVSTANAILENIATDIPTVFGANSPEAAEVKSDPNKAFADFVGIGVHCAKSASLCSAASGGRADLLPDEPGGYAGYFGLFGHKSVAAAIGSLADLNGNPIVNPLSNTPGFPGFDGMSASVSLGYLAAMQEHGVPVTYAYISDAHDAHPSGPAYGPGQAGYVAALASYDAAFAKFFARLAADGIDQSNTLFVFTSDEGDHFAGGTPTPAGCDGVNTPCNYSHVTCPSASVPTCPADNVGELNANMAGILATQQHVTTKFRVHADSAPTVYITGNPGRTDATTRAFERATASLTAPNFYTGNPAQNPTLGLADAVEMKLLHMLTADPARTPTFTWFADPTYFLFAGAPTCTPPCVQEQPGFAWNHGSVASDITTTWLGLAGPGVRNLGVTADVWSDHTDIRPTTLSLVGLKDDYASDGRVLVEPLYDWAVPQTLRAHRETLLRLAQAYKQINAPVGALGLATLKISTLALGSSTANDQTYKDLESRLASLTGQRNTLAATMSAMLGQAAFDGRAINEQDAQDAIAQAQALLQSAGA
ncbi:MAG TPA: hypothetical protein VET82_13435 [Candidatus Eisenbacteria bacterium]|nr:hypothetical protein [Candidatus Eisenbacteria bacterium]